MKTISPAKNPLLNCRDMSRAELRLIESYSLQVKAREHEIGTDDGLYLIFHIGDLVQSNHYKQIYDANKRLRQRSMILDHREIDMEGETGFISSFRMGRGDGKLIVKIPKPMIEHYLEVAELPYILWSTRFDSDYDRPLYLLNNAIADFHNTMIENEVEVNGYKFTVYPAEKKGKGWSHVLLKDLCMILDIKQDSYFGTPENFKFGLFKERILTPRFRFITANTDLICEFSNRQGRVRVTGIDIRATRKAVEANGVRVHSLTEYQLWEMLETLFSSKKHLPALKNLNQHQIIRLYVAALTEKKIYHRSQPFEKGKRTLNDWATLLVAARFPHIGVTHPEIQMINRMVRFEEVKKELAA